MQISTIAITDYAKKKEPVANHNYRNLGTQDKIERIIKGELNLQVCKSYLTVACQLCYHPLLMDDWMVP
jgi:hypothetical protein